MVCRIRAGYLLRARLAIYVVLLLAGSVVFARMAGERQSFQVNAIRSRGLPFTITEDHIRNLYTLHLQNKSDRATTYLLAPGKDATARLGGSVKFIIPQRNVRLAALTDAQVPIFVEVPRSAYTEPTDFHIAARDSLSGEEQLLKLRFRGP